MSLVCIVLICALVVSAILSVSVTAAGVGNARSGAAVHGENTAVTTITAPDGYDSVIVWAQRMRVKDDGRVTIHHHDSSLRFQSRADTTTDYCSGLLTNKENKNKYRILDPKGVE